MVSQRVVCHRFIGRVAEINHLALQRRAAGDSHGGAVIVLGEPGIGKSRLVQEYRERYSARSPVATGTCREFGQRAFEPLAQMLAQLEPPGMQPLSAGSTALTTKEERVAAILSAFDRSASRRTTTLIVEDAHWAQPELLQMLTTLAEWSANRRLLLIVTWREGELPASSPTFKALARLSRHASILRLEPFNAAELSELMVGALADFEARLPAGTFNDVRRRSAGNPLFAEELLRHAVDEHRRGRGRRTRSNLPISLQGVIRERLDRCEPRDRDLLSAASVFGQRFRIDLLADVFGLERVEIVAALGRLIELQLVDRCEDPLAYEFRHALARDVIYGDLIPAEAHALHLRIARAIEALPDAAAHAELLAHSFWQAQLPDRAAPHCEAAGEGATAQFAYEDAALWFERAATAYEGRAADAGRVLRKAALALDRLNDPKRAASFYGRAIASFSAGGNFEAAVHTTTYLAALLYNNAEEVEALAAMDRALGLAVRSGAPSLQHHVLIRRLSLLCVKGERSESLACLAAIDEAALDPESRDTFEYYLSKSHVHALVGEPGLRRESVDRALALLERRNAPAHEWRFAHGFVAVDALALGEMEAARTHAEAGLAVARRIRSSEPYMLGLLAEIEEHAGRFQAARGYLDAIAPEADFLSRHMHTVATIRIALASGDDDLLRDVLDLEMLREAERGGHRNMSLQLTCAFAAGLERLGRRHESRELAERAVAAIDTSFSLAWEIGALARLLPGRIERLRTIVAPPGSGASSVVDEGLCALLDARTAREAGSAAAGEMSAREAARRFAQLGWPVLEAECLELAGDRASAVAIYRRLGCAYEVRRIERSTAPGEPHAGVLSPRERELARLVALGKNNREAALELSVTVKAVEKYLTSIYQKLGIKSRSQLTAFVGAAEPEQRRSG
jgi:DNA-binding CsgD family transcriptional regulator